MVIAKKRQNRIKDTSEVFTPPSAANKMLDKLPEEVWNNSFETFLDNSAGNGNFLIEILNRKLEHNHPPLQALSTIYGVEIMKDNIAECKLRLYKIVKPLLSKEERKKAQEILNRNIVCADALTYDYSFK